MAFSRFEPLARHPLVYVEFDDAGKPVGVVDVMRHLREHYQNVSLLELRRFVLDHNHKRRALLTQARRAFAQRTGRTVRGSADLRAPEFDEYRASPQLDTETMRSVGSKYTRLGTRLDRWSGSVAPGSEGYRLLQALYLQTPDRVLRVLFQPDEG